jgi:hypothetical protein
MSSDQLALADTRTGATLVPMSDTGSLMNVIARAASDPNTDVEKLERLMALFERVKDREARTAYIEALGAVQQVLPAIQERGGIEIGRGAAQKYARWEDINTTIKPILAQHGFALSFRTGFDKDRITVTGVLSHRLGHSEETTIYLPSDTSGSKNAVQAVGSSTSYGKRYTAIALLNITSTDEDDDGKSGGGDGPISEDQCEKVRDLIDRTGANIELFCKYFKIEAVPELRAKDYHRAIERLNLKLGGKK